MISRKISSSIIVAEKDYQVQLINKRFQVREIRRYTSPHAAVRDTLVATYILLGEPPDKLKVLGLVKTRWTKK